MHGSSVNRHIETALPRGRIDIAEYEIGVTDRTGPLPLSLAQQRLWFLAQLNEGASRAYHSRVVLRFRGPLERGILRAALDRIVERHESLRTRIGMIDGVAVQRIDSARSRFALRELALEEEQRDLERRLQALIQQEGSAAFDLAAGPLARGLLIRVSAEEHLLLITMHHLVTDGWSMGVLLRELKTLYAAYREGKSDPLPLLPIQYADYAVWQRKWLQGERLQQQSEYWQQRLRDAPQLLTLPLERERPSVPDYVAAAVDVELDEELTTALKELSQRHRTTLFVTILASWAVLLSRLSRQDDIVIGTPVANRSRGEIEALIGVFVSTLAIRVDLADSPSVAELLRRVRERVLEAQDHQDIPFERVVELLNPVRTLSHSPVFQVALAWQNLPQAGREWSGSRVERIEFLRDTTELDWSLFLRPHEGRIAGSLVYATALFDRETVERYLGYWKVLLHGMVAEEARGVDRLEILPAAERERVVVEWNRTQVAYPAERCIHELFEEQVRKAPEATAVVDDGRRLSYAQLNESANRLSSELRKEGVEAGDSVALALQRGIQLIVCELAVSKCGAAYVPIDPDWPEERQRLIVKDCQAKCVLLERVSPAWQQSGLRPLEVAEVLARRPSGVLALADPGVAIDGDASACVMYTSGSTGEPKGVLVSHRGISNLAMNGRYAQAGVGDLIAFAANPAFDASTFELWSALLNGAGVLVVSPAAALDARCFARLLRDHGVTIVFLTTSLFHRYVREIPEPLAALRYLFFGGEACDPRITREFVRHGAPHGLINGYGPTECTTFCTWYGIEGVEEQAGSVPIGRPLANTQIYILDRYMQPVPVGVEGELYVGGVGVARGYLNRPELTAERFVQDPFSDASGARLYRTGDLARWRPDGNIEYRGRNDHQVKIRGYRIELGEIEAHLVQHPAVKEAVVLAREDEPGEKRLVAYYTCATHSAADVEDLRAHLLKQLPGYMVPAAYVRLEELPLTPNGKLDRKALPEPQGAAYAQRSYEAPEGEIETVLAQIWRELLKLERIGRQDNFFELGGHSLLAMQLTSRILQMFATEVSVQTVFHSPSIRALAEAIARGGASAVLAFSAVDRKAPLPLSFAQQRLWFLARLEEAASQAYHIALSLRLQGPLDRRALRAALDRIVARHESLRTRFVTVHGVPLQQIVPAEVGFALVESDLEDGVDGSERLRGLIEQEARAAFDLTTGPLIRGQMIRRSEQEHLLLITMHHIVADGWSMRVLFRELAALYATYREGRSDPLPPLSFQYADYAVWQRQWLQGERLQRQSEYWRKTLEGVSQRLDLPADRARPAAQDYAGAALRVEFDEPLTRGLKRLSQRHNGTLFMTVLGGLAVLLARLSGQQEVLIGTPAANRTRVEIEPLIGFFVNTLAIRVDLSGEPSTVELLERVRRQVLAAQAHQDIPFEQLVELLAVERSLAHSPVFQVMLAWQTQPEHAVVSELADLKMEVVTHRTHTAAFDLTVSLTEIGDRICGAMIYATSLFDSSTIERYLTYWKNLLQGMVRTEEVGVGRLEILPVEERERVVVVGNCTQVAYPGDRCIHELFEDQVGKTPDAIAALCEGRALTYADLNAQANRLARHLRTKGVGPDTFVGVCVERSLPMLVGLLGTLKAGGAYVPLDSRQPDRLSYILRDSEPLLLLADAAGRAVLPEESLLSPVIDVQADARRWAENSPTNLACSEVCVHSGHLAYVIHLSGSTAELHGVSVEHRSTVNLVCWHQRREEGTAPPRTLQFAPLGSSGAFQEIFSTLCLGGTLVLAPQDMRTDPGLLARMLREESITRAFLPSALLAQSVSELAVTLPGCEHFVSGREPPIAGESIVRTVQSTGARLHQQYGPPECHPAASLETDPEDSAEFAPLGRPIANTQIYVLDRNMQPVPIGVVGEICVGGAGLARGYLNQSQLTAERFVKDPFSEARGARLYRTGDFGRFRSTGEIELLGRSDWQARTRGDRIPLEGAALAAADGQACRSRPYEPPQGETESVLAGIYQELLPVERVSRHDNFFELGGHSLLAVTLTERLRERGLRVDVRDLYNTATLARLAQRVERGPGSQIPQNLIPEHCDRITPEMLTLVALKQNEIDWIVERVNGGAANIQDIYPLAPLQEGILFHHLLKRHGDPYVLQWLLGFESREQLDRFVAALQTVIDRHDILRTGVMWEGASEPVQVVWRKATLPLEEIQLTGDDAMRELRDRFHRSRYRLDVRQAPLQRAFVAFDREQNRWLLLVMLHHLAVDHVTGEMFFSEVQAHLLGREGLRTPVPYRNFVAQARLGVSAAEHKAFFGQMLGDIDEPTAPFGLLDVYGDGADVAEARIQLDGKLAQRLRACARAAGVSAASLCHLAWGRVLSQLVGREDVVFGTVLFGRMHGGEGAEQGVGLFMNTLPIRLSVGEQCVGQALRATHEKLGQLLRHEHASLTLAQRCSAVPAQSPLFTSLLNYRYTRLGAVSATDALHRGGWGQIASLYADDRSNYPLALSVDDLGEGFALKAQVNPPIEPQRICDLMQTALAGLVDALGRSEGIAIRAIALLSAAERERVVVDWNRTAAPYPSDRCTHELFEEQVRRTPGAIAVEYDRLSLSYRQLNEQANRLAHYLRERGVQPDTRVGICAERSPSMVIGLLGILKAGGAYVPLDPGYPRERLQFMLTDSAPLLLLVDGEVRKSLGELAAAVPLIDLRADEPLWMQHSGENPVASAVGLTPRHLAYVIYTSGSTGVPKGVMNEHRGVVNRLTWMQDRYVLEARDAVLQKTPFGFDVSVWEFFWTLLNGARLVMARPGGHQDPVYLRQLIRESSVTRLHFVPSMLQNFLEQGPLAGCDTLRQIVCSGEELPRALLQRCLDRLARVQVSNLYGPTEAAIDVTFWDCRAGEAVSSVPIGRPVANTQIYILDRYMQPVPVGVEGELYIGGVGVARGYLNRPELTAERFVQDPFSDASGARLYRTGDLARWRPDGNIEYRGRNDHQVKIRGYRIELGEIEAHLVQHPAVKEAVVLAREDEPGEKRLVAYYTCATHSAADVEDLRAHLQKQLPGYMVPAAYVRLEKLPLTPNGKQDRKALPAPQDAAYAQRSYEAPEGEIETVLAQIWRELLKLERIGRQDNFFELGGDSLLAMQLTAKVMQTLEIEVSVGIVMQCPTISELAEVLREETAEELERASASAPTQEILRRLWSRILAVDSVGAADDFFELGGDSALAAELIERISALVNRKVPPRLIGETPVFGAFADALEAWLAGAESPAHTNPYYLFDLDSRGDDDAHHLTLLRAGPGIRSLFCMHAISGSVAPYLSLLNGLGNDCRVFGLDAAPLLLGDDFSGISLETLASRYLAEIRGVEPHGPYCLCGYSLGAAVALEIAQHLRREGRDVAFLGALDWAPFPQLPRAPELVAKEKWLTFLILAAGPDTKWLVADDAHDFWKMTKRERLLFAQRATRLQNRRFLIDNASVSRLARQFDLFEALYDAHRKYVAQPYDGTVVYFRATASPDMTAVWRKYARNVVYRCIDGGHGEIVESGKGAAVGEMIAELIS